MSKFEVLVREVEDVRDHPNADRLSLVRVLGYEAITAKNEDGSHRFSKGQAVIYVPEAAVIPESLLRHYGFWNDAQGIGMLAGKRGDRVKAIRLRGILSQGLVWPLAPDTLGGNPRCGNAMKPSDHEGSSSGLFVNVGYDVADFFGITKYEPEVPKELLGEVAGMFEFNFDFDIENEQNFPGFLEHDEVEATEKLHGICTRVAYRHGFEHPDLFGNNCVAITSKGLGDKGMVFKDNEKNKSNVYVSIVTKLGLVEKIERLGKELGQSVDLFGEIFGPGVQDLHYGLREKTFRAFDIAIDGEFLPTDEKIAMFERLGVERVPVLYRGPWDREALVVVRDGKTSLGQAGIREGIVVTSTGAQTKRDFLAYRLRPILKMISPDYLTRKGETTEYT